MTELVEIGRFGALADAEQRALVLAAVGIEAHLIADTGVVRLCVTASEAWRARHELGCYERENAPWRPRFRARAVLHRVEGAFVYAAVLLFFFGAQRRHALSTDWLAAGAANAGRILDIVFQLAEVAVPRALFAEILRGIEGLRLRRPPVPA